VNEGERLMVRGRGRDGVRKRGLQFCAGYVSLGVKRLQKTTRKMIERIKASRGGQGDGRKDTRIVGTQR